MINLITYITHKIVELSMQSTKFCYLNNMFKSPCLPEF